MDFVAQFMTFEARSSVVVVEDGVGVGVAGGGGVQGWGNTRWW